MSNLFSLENFEWHQEGVTLRIRETEVGEQRVFHVVFSDQRKPLVLTQMKSFAGTMWTSIPAGRKETNDVGAIIEAHFKEG
ncbi:hypothetical protein D3C71_26810 [compost metagenome]